MMESSCEICEKNPITIKCLDCTKIEYYCKSCFELSHSSDSKRAHKRANASVKEVSKFLCSVHDKEREYVCKTCRKTICFDCSYVGSDKGHDFISYKVVSPWIQELSDNSLKVYNEAIEELKNLAKEEMPKKEKFRAFVDNSKLEIAKKTSEIIDMINKKKEKECKAIDTIYSEFLKQCEQVQVIQNECEESIKSIKSVYSDFELKKTPDNCDKAVQYKAPDISALRNKIEDTKKIINAKSYDEYVKRIENKVMYSERMNPLSFWEVDRCYLSKYFSLSEDGLTLTNPTGYGIPTAIGDTFFNRFILAYEVIPSGLNQFDGFGIIEFEKFKEIFNQNQNNPNAYRNMIGNIQGQGVQNMTVVNGSELINDKKYTVVADFERSIMTIQGSECSLTANLKQGVNYVPCFSCCYHSSKFTIKPI